MSLRGTSGKFSLPTFGRKHSADPNSPSRMQGEDFGPASPSRENGYYSGDGGSGGGGGGGGGSRVVSGGREALDGFGKNLGKKIAHQSLLPALGNKEARPLQDVISMEKNVMSMTEKLALDTGKAAAALPAYGASEGPDLQDVLGHSATLLTRLSSALEGFMNHQASLRICWKRIRAREEALAELRRRRRETGNKAENAEKKLAKMGPENKSLPQQTDLLERLRQEMRQMDTEIVTEESKLGDFKRQTIKEALSYKFGGLEELGEKMCIIGELGKLLLEEIPLEETPPGYGRAPYNGYDKTANAVNEADKCLSTVQFHAANNTPKPPGLPHTAPMQPLTAPNMPGDRVSAAEEYANYPGNAASPPAAKGKGRDFALDENPYGGINNPYGPPDMYSEFGGTRGGSSVPPAIIPSSSGQRETLWQGPTDEALQQHNEGHAYEYEQQRQLEAERAEQDAEAAWRTDTPARVDVTGVNGTPSVEESATAPWEPLNVKNHRGATPDPQSAPGVPPVLEPPAILTDQTPHHPDHLDLPPPPSMAALTARSVTPSANSDFHTPMEQPDPLAGGAPEVPSSPSLSIPPPSALGAAGGGKISAAAFRKARPQPRTSLDSTEDVTSPTNGGARRLPVPPIGGAPRSVSGSASPALGQADAPRFGVADAPAPEAHHDAYGDAEGEVSPPPQYGGDSLR